MPFKTTDQGSGAADIDEQMRLTCCEAENLGSLVAVERLEGSPPPCDDWVGLAVTVVLGGGAPLVDINVRCSRDQQLDLLIVELR